MKTTIRRVLLYALSVLLVSCGGSSEPPAPAARTEVLASGIQSSARTVIEYDTLVQQIYVAYFGRPADPAGLAYWSAQFLSAAAPTDMVGLVAAYGANPAVKTLVDVFGTSKESNDLYPGSNASFIGAVYRNLFSREGDAAGIAYWTDLLDRGVMTRSIAALTLMTYAQSSDITVVANKVAVARIFTASLKLPTQISSYSGLDANVRVRGLLSNVIDTTLPDAMQATVNFLISDMAKDWQAGEKPPAGTAASVTSVEPTSAMVGQLINFVVRGSNLGAGLAVNLSGCSGMFSAGGTSVNRIFSCIPSSPGAKAGTVTEAAGGKLLFAFTMNVSQPSVPVVQSFSPGTAIQNKRTTFTVTGTDLTAGMSFSLEACSGAIELAGGSSAQRQYDCTPAKVGPVFGALRDKFGTLLANLAVTVIAAPPSKLSIDSTALTFSQQTPGTASAAQVVTVTNTGTGVLANLSVNYSFPSPFSYASTCGSGLAAGARCTISVKFAPDVYWVNNSPLRSGQVTIASDGGNASVSVSGTVPPLPRPALRMTPVSLAFAARAVGTSSAAQSVIITNTGSAPLDITCIDTPRIDKPTDCYVFHTANLGLPFDYTYTATCGFNPNLSYPPTDAPPFIIQPVANLAPGASCTISVVFKPSTAGARNGILIVDSNASNLANGVVGLSGSGASAVPVVSTYSPSVATLNQPTVFTFTGTDLIAGMSFTLDGCFGIVELGGGSSTQRQFSCTPGRTGTLNGTLTANGSSLGTFSVTVSAPSGPPPSSGADYSTSFSIGESSESSFVLTDRNPRHLSTGDTFILNATEKVWAFTAAQYAVNVYALDAGNAQAFLDGRGFEGYLLCGSAGQTGMCFPTLPAGKYWIGTVPNQSVSAGYSNPVYHEVSTGHTLPKWNMQSNVGMFTGGPSGYWKAQAFTFGSGDVRAYIETEGYGGKFMIMDPTQYRAFSTAYPNGFQSGSYSYTYACGGKTGGPDTEIECELKLSAGSYYLVYINDTGSWAGGAANIEFYTPR